MEVVLSGANFTEEVLESDIPVLVDFWATWCGPCKMLSPIVEKLAEELDGKVKIGKVNVDDEQELAINYNVEVIPTLILFKNGKEVKRTAGYFEKEEIIANFGL